jgi:hypothetical protein
MMKFGYNIYGMSDSEDTDAQRSESLHDNDKTNLNTVKNKISGSSGTGTNDEKLEESYSLSNEEDNPPDEDQNAIFGPMA